ncbi:MAG: hypothetical protein AVDCRST_MAG80-2574, partial [uncultured Rubrobacteraceae bacterium]
CGGASRGASESSSTACGGPVRSVTGRPALGSVASLGS